MLFELLHFLTLAIVVSADEVSKSKEKPYSVIPVPLEFPNRNDRSEQCYVRIEDIMIVETISTYCDVAHEFLRHHLKEYNEKKQEEDGVEVNIFSDSLAYREQLTSPAMTEYDNIYKNIKHWKQATILDPITHLRIYVSKKAECHLIMYSRDATSNYNVDCELLLTYINESSNSCAVFNKITTYSLQIYMFSVLFLLIA